MIGEGAFGQLCGGGPADPGPGGPPGPAAGGRELDWRRVSRAYLYHAPAE